MNPSNQKEWQNRALETVFEAMAASHTLAGKFAYKGARILSKRLGEDHRQSYDIDLNLTEAFVQEYPDPRDQEACLYDELRISLETFLRDQNPIRYQLRELNLKRKPKEGHPRGWDAFKVRILLEDMSITSSRGLPALELDIAAPEDLGPRALEPLAVGSFEVLAYSLERIAGEKLRAFLSSLPTYCLKMKKPGRAVRAKDLYDLSRILRARPVEDQAFWKEAGSEFKRACRSRFVDCRGMESFSEQIDVTRATYDRDATIPKDIDFDAVWREIEIIVNTLETHGVHPFEYPLTEGVAAP